MTLLLLLSGSEESAVYTPAVECDTVYIKKLDTTIYVKELEDTVYVKELDTTVYIGCEE